MQNRQQKRAEALGDHEQNYLTGESSSDREQGSWRAPTNELYYLDSCCSVHASKNKEHLASIRKGQGYMGSNTIEAEGTLGGMSRCVYVPNQTLNLLSEPQIEDQRNDLGEYKYTIEICKDNSKLIKNLMYCVAYSQPYE